MCAIGGDELADLFSADLEQFSDIVIGLTMVTDHRRSLGLVNAVAGDLLRGA